MRILRLICIFNLAMIVSACGVKGKPSPPLEPTPIGNGRPLQDKANLNKAPIEETKKDENAK